MFLGDTRAWLTNAGLALACWLALLDAGATFAAATGQTNAVPADSLAGEFRWTLRAYEVRGVAALTTNLASANLQKFTGTNLTMVDLARAAWMVQTELGHQGQTNVSVSISPREMTNG